jgi:integrase/recombinase XerD
MQLNQAIESFIDYLEMIDRSKSTQNDYRYSLSKFNEFLQNKHNGPVYVEDIVLQDLEDFLMHEKERGMASASRSSMLYTIKSFYNYMCKKDLCDKNLALLLEPIKVKQKERDYLTEEEFEELINAITSPLIRAVIQTMFYTGGRITEITNLKLEDVDLENNILHIIGGKGNKDRDIPISLKLHKILSSYLKNVRKPEVKTDRFFTTKMALYQERFWSNASTSCLNPYFCRYSTKAVSIISRCVTFFSLLKSPTALANLSLI